MKGGHLAAILLAQNRGQTTVLPPALPVLQKIRVARFARAKRGEAGSIWT